MIIKCAECGMEWSDDWDPCMEDPPGCDPNCEHAEAAECEAFKTSNGDGVTEVTKKATKDIVVRFPKPSRKPEFAALVEEVERSVERLVDMMGATYAEFKLATLVEGLKARMRHE